MMGMGEKLRNTKNEYETQEKNPRLVALPFAFQRNGNRLFSSIRKDRNKPGLPLVGEDSYSNGALKLWGLACMISHHPFSENLSPDCEIQKIVYRGKYLLGVGEIEKNVGFSASRGK